jgi:hypothetical protein
MLVLGQKEVPSCHALSGHGSSSMLQGPVFFFPLVKGALSIYSLGMARSYYHIIEKVSAEIFDERRQKNSLPILYVSIKRIN